MVSEIMIVALALMFLIISILMFFGKGKWLIAGYNTASEEEKKKYDDKKLCRSMSLLAAVCSVMLCIMSYMMYQFDTGLISENAMNVFGFIFVAVILTSVVAVVLYINTKGKIK